LRNIRPDRGGRGPSRAPHESEGNPSGIFEGSGGDPAKRPRPHPGESGFFNRLLARRRVAIAAGLIGAAAVVYLLALGTAWGRELDAEAVQVRGMPHIRPGSPELLVFSLPWLAAAGSLGLLALALGAQALRRGGREGVLAAASVVAGAFLAAELLKWGLGQLTPFAADTAHGSAASFPSAHATVGTALVLGLAAVAPERLRPAALGAAVAYPVGIALLALLEGWHYPSDVVAGDLLGAAWIVGVAAVAPEPRSLDGDDERLRQAALGCAAGAAALLAIALIASAARFVPDWLLVGPFLAGAVACTASAGAGLLAARAAAVV
jgi:membrane-associated phospholipid phosphatase